MTVDLTKLVFHSGYPAFKNNNRFSGSFNITGSSAGGTNQRTETVNLSFTPDMTDIIFNGPTDTVFSSDPRPSTGWFKQGAVWVLGNNAGAGYTDYPTPWVITSKLTGQLLTITATYVQTFSDALTLTSTTVYYRIVDYSVF
jgi:hypothetical protein